MLKKIAIILTMALCLSVADATGQSFVKTLKKQGKKILKEQVQSSKKSSGSSTTTTTTTSTKKTTKKTTRQTGEADQKTLDAVAVLDASTTAKETPNVTVPPTEHSIYFEPLTQTDTGKKSPAITMPPTSGAAAQQKWYNAQPGVSTLTNKRLVDEYVKLEPWIDKHSTCDELVRYRKEQLLEQIQLRCEAMKEYTNAAGNSELPDWEEDWVKQYAYRDLANALQSDIYARTLNSSTAPLYKYLEPECKAFFESHGSMETADSQTRTVWQPYGETQKFRTSIPGVYGEMALGKILIQGAYYFLNEDNGTARVDEVTREIVEKTPNYVIPDTITDYYGRAYSVTSINSGAFAACNLQSITLPKNLEFIGNSAFSSLKGVTKIVIPDKVTCLQRLCFSGCRDLVEIYVPNSVVEMGACNFNECPKLKTVRLPERVNKFDMEQFSDCKALTTVKLPEGITEIKEKMFYDCTDLKSITIPSSVKTIEGDAFAGCTALTSVTFNEGLEEISDRAFEKCKMLTKIVFPNSLRIIGWDAFKGLTRLTSVVMSDNIEKIDALAFDGCSSLTSVSLPGRLKGDAAFLIAFGYTPVFTQDGGAVTQYVHYR